MLPYFLGCPSWSESAWRGSLYPQDASASEFLAAYTGVFNAVEGNTTFYARPSAAVIERWAALFPEGFRFTAKFPRDISHAGDLTQHQAAAQAFVALLAPLGRRVSPFWLQLPASFGPQRINELLGFIDSLQQPLAIEVRHLAFFAKGEEERALNGALRERGVERICLDSRALFACVATDPAVLHAQSKKPRLPPRPTAFSQSPQVRFIGGPDLHANDLYLAQWVVKVAGWIEEGRTPYVFLHTPDNHLAAAQACRFHEQLMQRLPGLPALPVTEAPVRQLNLL